MDLTVREGICVGKTGLWVVITGRSGRYGAELLRDFYLFWLQVSQGKGSVGGKER